MVIEVLFNESCNLHGDGENVTYLQKTLPDSTFIFTNITQKPYFVDNRPDMIYIGSMSEAIQRRVITTLMPYKERIKELIDDNVVILATGNAGEIFTKKIDYMTEHIEIDGLNIVDEVTKTDFFNRYNGKVIGTFEDIKVVGFRSQFSFIYGNNTNNYFIKCDRGIGIHKNSHYEGIRYKNLIITQIIGPLLPLNPLFTEKLLELAGEKHTVAFKEEAMKAYEQHLKEFENPNTNF